MKITEVELKILCMLAVSSLRTSDIAEKLDRNNAYVGVYVSKLKEKELIERDNSAYGICFKISQSGIAHLTKRVPDAANVCRVINHFYVEGVCSRVARKSRGAGNAKPLGVPPFKSPCNGAFLIPKKEDATAILLFISVGFTLYFRSIEMYSAAIGSAIVAVFVLVLWIGEL